MDVVLPMAVLLIPFALFLGFYILYSLFNLYHLLRFGLEGIPLLCIILVFLGGSGLLVGGSLFALSQYDWSGEISPFETIDTLNQDSLFRL